MNRRSFFKVIVSAIASVPILAMAKGSTNMVKFPSGGKRRKKSEHLLPITATQIVNENNDFYNKINKHSAKHFSMKFDDAIMESLKELKNEIKN